MISLLLQMSSCSLGLITKMTKHKSTLEELLHMNIFLREIMVTNNSHLCNSMWRVGKEAHRLSAVM